MGRSGDPRKRNTTGKPPATGYMYWQPFRHTCGCYLDWGVDMGTAKPHEFVVYLAQERVTGFLSDIREWPCPMHGSASGDPAPPLAEGTRRYIRDSNAWYRLCSPEDHHWADRLTDAIANNPTIKENP